MSKIKRSVYLANETLFEKSCEQNIDMEINLPDYCGDISRILHCFAFPNITSSSINSDKINLEGTVLVRLLYISNGEIFSYEQSCDFSKQIDHNCDTVGAVLDITTAVQYLNCRAASSRKAEIHGAFVITAKISACQSRSVIDSINTDDMQVNKDTITACSASGNASALINISQVADIGTDKSGIRSIIRNTAFPVIEETKQVSGKVLVKGELKVKTLYKSEDNGVEYIENVLPLSQILDIEGVDENSTVDIKATLSSLDVAVKPSALGNMSLLDINAVVALNACSYNCIDFPVVKDAYSTVYETNCSFKNVSVDRIVNTVSKTYIYNLEIPNISDISRVVDAWCDEISCRASLDDGNLIFSGALKGYVLYETEEGTLALKSDGGEFTFSENVGSAQSIKCSPNAVILGTDYILSDNSVQIRANIKINAVVFECCNEKVVDDISVSDNPIDNGSSLFIYYSHKGEKLWDIARKYNTTVNRIMSENELDDDVLLNDKALLIWS